MGFKDTQVRTKDQFGYWSLRASDSNYFHQNLIEGLGSGEKVDNLKPPSSPLQGKDVCPLVFSKYPRVQNNMPFPLTAIFLSSNISTHWRKCQFNILSVSYPIMSLIFMSWPAHG